jgi:hypothetical protein
MRVDVRRNLIVRLILVERELIAAKRNELGRQLRNTIERHVEKVRSRTRQRLRDIDIVVSVVEGVAVMLHAALRERNPGSRVNVGEQRGLLGLRDKIEQNMHTGHVDGGAVGILDNDTRVGRDTARANTIGARHLSPRGKLNQCDATIHRRQQRTLIAQDTNRALGVVDRVEERQSEGVAPIAPNGDITLNRTSHAQIARQISERDSARDAGIEQPELRRGRRGRGHDGGEIIDIAGGGRSDEAFGAKDR